MRAGVQRWHAAHAGNKPTLCGLFVASVAGVVSCCLCRPFCRRAAGGGSAPQADVEAGTVGQAVVLVAAPSAPQMARLSVTSQQSAGSGGGAVNREALIRRADTTIAAAGALQTRLSVAGGCAGCQPAARGSGVQDAQQGAWQTPLHSSLHMMRSEFAVVHLAARHVRGLNEHVLILAAVRSGMLRLCQFVSTLVHPRSEADPVL